MLGKTSFPKARQGITVSEKARNGNTGLAHLRGHPGGKLGGVSEGEDGYTLEKSPTSPDLSMLC